MSLVRKGVIKTSLIRNIIRPIIKNDVELLEPPIASGLFNPPDGQQDVYYTYRTSGLFTGGAVESYGIATGSLPAGLTLNTATGTISGIPTTLETISGLSITATNIFGSDTTNTADIQITVELPIASGIFNPPDGSKEEIYPSYDTSVLFTGGTVVTYSIGAGTLPDGLVLDGASGIISGTPTIEESQAGISVTGTNAGGSDTTNTADIVISLPSGTGNQLITSDGDVFLTSIGDNFIVLEI